MQSILHGKVKVKFSHTRYRALGPEENKYSKQKLYKRSKKKIQAKQISTTLDTDNCLFRHICTVNNAISKIQQLNFLQNLCQSVDYRHTHISL